MNITLICIIILLLVCAVIGLKQGLLKMLVPLALSVTSILIMIFLTPEITKYIRENTEWDEAVYAATKEYFEENDLLLNAESLEDSEVISPILLKDIDGIMEEYMESGIESFNEYMIQKISDMIFSAGVMIGIFIAIIILSVIVRVIINLVGKMPVIRCVNRFAGMLTGILLGLLTVEVFFILLTVFHNTGWAVAVHQDISESVFLNLLYNNNLLLITITKIF